jgi:CBS domain-containing protein
MTRHLLTTTSQENLITVAQTMLENKIHCLPVLDSEQQLSGIITDSDLFRMVVKKFF